MTADPLSVSLVALAIGAGVVLFTYLAIRNSAATVAVLVATWILTTAILDQVDVSRAFAGTRVTALDVMSAIIALVGVIRILVSGVLNPARGLTLLLFGLLIVHVARGVADFGLQSAVSGSRDWLYFGAALVYGSSVSPASSSAIWKILVVAGGCLAAVAVPYFVVDGVHTATHEVLRNDVWVSSRPVVGAGALLIVQSAIIAIATGWPSPGSARALAAGEGVVLLLLQHRTIWIAGAVVALMGFIGWSRRRIGTSPETVFASTGFILLALPAIALVFVHTRVFVASAEEAVSHHSTFTWRTTGWTELIGTHHSPLDLLIGGPSGASWAREIGGQIVDRSAHNGFVDAYLRIGLPGVVLLAALGLILWRSRDLIAIRSGLPGAVVALILLTQLAFSVTFSLDLIQGIIVGVFAAGLAEKARSPAETHSPSVPLVGPPKAAYR